MPTLIPMKSAIVIGIITRPTIGTPKKKSPSTFRQYFINLKLEILITLSCGHKRSHCCWVLFWCCAITSAWSGNKTDEPHTFLQDVCFHLKLPLTEWCPNWGKEEKAGKSHTLQTKMSKEGCKNHRISWVESDSQESLKFSSWPFMGMKMYDTCLNEHNEHIWSCTGIHQGTPLGKAASRDSGGLRNLTNQEGNQDLMLANYVQVAGRLFF